MRYCRYFRFTASREMRRPMTELEVYRKRLAGKIQTNRSEFRLIDLSQVPEG